MRLIWPEAINSLKVDDAEFNVPEAKDSWCYMGLPEGMISRVPNGKLLKIED